MCRIANVYPLFLFVLSITLHAQFDPTPHSDVTLKYRFPEVGQLYSYQTTGLGLGDVNNDGYGDFAIVSQPIDPTSPNPLNHGAVIIRSGKDSSIIRSVLSSGANGSGRLAVCAAGDNNGDNYDDYAIFWSTASTAGVSGSGKFVIYSGQDGSTLLSFMGPAGRLNGVLMANMGDLNSDSVDDFVIRSKAENSGSPDRVHAISGLTGTNLYTITESYIDYDVQSLANGGDVNNDGTNDILIGEPNFGFPMPPTTQTPGQYRIRSGVDGSLIYTHYGLNRNKFGFRVAGVGDLNGDGFDDVAVSSKGGIDLAGGFFFSGNADIYSGESFINVPLFGPTPLVGLPVPTGYSGANTTLSAIGDLDGDGISEIAIDLSLSGTPAVGNTFRLDELRVWMSASPAGPMLRMISHDETNRSILGAYPLGDVNGDGKDDIGFTSIHNNPRQGEFHVYLGGVAPAEKIFSNSGNAPGLDYNWRPFDSIPNAPKGFLTAEGATPFANGIIAASLAPIDFPVGGIDLLIAVDPINFLQTATITANSNGKFSVGVIDRRAPPALAGSAIYSQVFEVSPTLRASNALKIFVVP